MSQPIRVLFLCTGNACRSQMAEALLRHLGGDGFEACSAGSAPAGYVHELADLALLAMQMPLAPDARSKSWDEFADVHVDVVITLCDVAAALPCPAWPSAKWKAHWPLPDPACHPGSPPERTDLAMRVAGRLMAKIEALTQLDFTQPSPAVQQALDRLGEI